MVTNNETLTKIAQYTNLVFCSHTLLLTLSLSHAYSTFSSLYFFYAFSLCWIRLCLSLALSHSLFLCMFVSFENPRHTLSLSITPEIVFGTHSRGEKEMWSLKHAHLLDTLTQIDAKKEGKTYYREKKKYTGATDIE